jgi:hypothetical protein
MPQKLRGVRCPAGNVLGVQDWLDIKTKQRKQMRKTDEG